MASVGIASGPRAGETVPLEGDLLIGRDMAVCQVVFADDDLVSREHARIARAAGGGWAVRDLGSTNGSWVTPAGGPRRRITGDHFLQNGDQIEIGGNRLVFVADADATVAVSARPAGATLGSSRGRPWGPPDREGAMIACPACQAGNPAGAQFCGSCGNQLAAGAPAAAGQAGFAYAGFWMRLLAAIIDSLILLIPNVIVLLAVDVFAAQLVLLIIRPAYTIGFWIGAEGATPGKMAMGIRIAMASGEPLGVGPAVLRYVGYFASAITLGIGYLMIAFTGEKRGLHDQIAGTVVIKTR